MWFVGIIRKIVRFLLYFYTKQVIMVAFCVIVALSDLFGFVDVSVCFSDKFGENCVCLFVMIRDLCV